MKANKILFIVMLLLWMLVPFQVSAQEYFFRLDELIVHLFWESDGTLTIDYQFVFTNLPGSHPIDFVDVGLPNDSFQVSQITAEIDGIPISYISRSEYQGSGTGVAVGLKEHAIQPGRRGTVHVLILNIKNVLYPDDEDSNYVSAVFSPTWFGSQYLSGNTLISVSFHLPPGVGPSEPRWHAAPAGFPAEPETSIDEAGRVVYTWTNPNANGYTQYLFGASFPKRSVPESAIVTPGAGTIFGLDSEDLIAGLFCCAPILFFGFISWFSVYSAQKRKLQYMPPKIAIEGHGIKRGLTAVEAAILLEQPLDKILTMTLFSCIKKGAATVVSHEPLEIEVSDPLPEDLRVYEKEFLDAFKIKNKKERQKALQEMVIHLVEEVSKKMKGFSRRETIDYYRDIIKRAWVQVEAAETPQVRSELFEQAMEWTMLDRDYEDRTRDIFRTGPVIVPTWYPRYDPVYRRTISTSSAPAPTLSTPGKINLPHLPGSDFAASLVNSVQNFSSSVIGNLNEFTSSITQKTNPPPKVTSSSRSYRSGSGCACACACACAGCACACAGGGR